MPAPAPSPKSPPSAAPPSLVPLPGAIDHHQAHNAASIDADVIDQAEFAAHPAHTAELLAHTLQNPDMLAMKAHATAEHGRPQAASTLADLVQDLVARKVQA